MLRPYTRYYAKQVISLLKGTYYEVGSIEEYTEFCDRYKEIIPLIEVSKYDKVVMHCHIRIAEDACYIEALVYDENVEKSIQPVIAYINTLGVNKPIVCKTLNIFIP